eukprot:TRINITY_DN12796_c0_g1_i1.p1 TRINITY_DN12796_c0_g1~~TRINITY_DN12796_c0_g1_i1.p1  ORF type:complete len:318 (-),score=46.19 TRINITY_DN12796_c0_g1_i1:137-1090(-)
MQKHLILWLGGYYKASYATCYALCTTSWHWAEVSLTSTSPTHPRFFPASALVNQQLFAWGGRYYSGGDDKYFDDLLELDLSTMARTYQLRAHVRHVPTSGTAPEAKFAATLTNVHDARLILFGGAQWKIGGACNPDSSLHVLDLHSRVWTHHLLARVPRPRLQHQARLIGRGELLLVLGGYDGRNKEYLGCRDWAVLNLRSLEWVRGALYDPGQDVGMEPVRADDLREECAEWHPEGWLCGMLPCPRAGMAVTMRHGDTEATVFGGAQYVANRWYRDVFELKFGGELPADPEYMQLSSEEGASDADEFATESDHDEP